MTEKPYIHARIDTDSGWHGRFGPVVFSRRYVIIEGHAQNTLSFGIELFRRACVICFYWP